MINAIANVFASILAFLKDLTGNYGLAIILLTLLVRLLLHPLTRKQLNSMKAMQALAPHISALREKYRDDPKQLNAETMNLYRAHNVNPFGGCLPMLVQLPVLFALFAVFRRPGLFNGASFLGLSLEALPTLGAIAREPILASIPLLSGLSTYWQQRMTVSDPQQARMFIFMPIMVAYFATNFPVGLSLYWIVSTLGYVLEYYIVVGRKAPAPALAPVKPEIFAQRPKDTKKK